MINGLRDVQPARLSTRFNLRCSCVLTNTNEYSKMRTPGYEIIRIAYGYFCASLA